MRSISLLLLLSLSLPLCAQDAASAFVPGRAQRIADTLARHVENGRHAGLSFVVLRDGQVLAEGAFGKADVATGEVLQRDAIVRIYSMTKPITAVAALTLVEQGLLRLDQPIHELLPELNKSGVAHDWWTIDLCFWPDAWVVTERCKVAIDELNKKHG